MVSERLHEAYRGSYYTIIGTGGDLNDWKVGYSHLLEGFQIGTVTEWFDFTGKDMNEEYGLTGDNAYPDDLHFLAFPVDGLDIPKLARFKIFMGDRWFDDIVDANARRECLKTEE